jgi:hypothetical protein
MVLFDPFPAHVPNIYSSVGLVKVITEIDNRTADYGCIFGSTETDHHTRYLFESTTFGGIRDSAPKAYYSIE